MQKRYVFYCVFLPIWYSCICRHFGRGSFISFYLNQNQLFSVYAKDLISVDDFSLSDVLEIALLIRQVDLNC